MSENNAAQPGLTDEEILDIADGFDIYGAKPEFARAIESALLSKLRAEGVPAGDERALPTSTAGRDPIIHAVASLAAAISLLERTPNTKKVAASDKMFAQMLADYRVALENARAALASTPVAGEAQPVAWLHQCRKKPELATVTMNKREPALAAKGYRPIPLYAAPQANTVAGEAVYEIQDDDNAHIWHEVSKDRYDGAAHYEERRVVYSAPPAPQASKPDFADAYEGAREDLAIWRRRALAAERDLRAERETSSRLVAAINAENGPTYMGDAAPQASEAVRPCTCHPDDRPAGECQKKYAAQECQTQADKDGGDCAKGAGDGEEAFEAWLYLGQTEFEPSDLNKDAISLAQLAYSAGRAALSAQPSGNSGELAAQEHPRTDGGGRG